jgi:hypothetical protein
LGINPNEIVKKDKKIRQSSFILKEWKRTEFVNENL